MGCFVEFSVLRRQPSPIVTRYSVSMTSRPFLAALCAAALLPLAASAQKATAAAPSSTDKYAWLEEVSSPRSLDWVRAEDARSLKVLEADPHYAAFHADALKVAESPDRLPAPMLLLHNEVYNFWQDATHVHGILRRTTLSDYNAPGTPHWHTVLDIDALGRQDGVAWVFKGLDCLYPGDEFCLVNLSAGGEDAVTVREFNLRQEAFVPNGFVSDHSKQQVAWLDKDTLLIARDWGAGTMTASSYPFVLKQWKRGTPLSSATEIFRGTSADISARAEVLDDAHGDHLTLYQRGLSFFERGFWLATPGGPVRLALPVKSGISGVVAGRLLVSTQQDWNVDGHTIPQGSLVELSIKDVTADPAHLHPSILFAPTADEFLQSAEVTRDAVVLTTLKHVQGRVYVYTPTTAGWTHRAIPIPENLAVHLAASDPFSNTFFFAATGFLTPTSLMTADAVSNTPPAPSRVAPEQFDASRDTVEQFDATSADGTRIPYFVVHRKDIRFDGANPTLLNAYGGFEVGETPSYSATIGKLWLEHGGVFVLANIRGGGEFGPAWHEAGLKTHRQRIYDDFAAVAKDLIAKKITSPRHLGIMGGSNGGLLMGVEFEQHPDLWNAVVIQVPLLDMLGFEHIAAGASWVGEYGSTSVPEERAFLAKISPYNNLKPGVKYPEPLIFTTTKDDRVGPQHARKFAALMEEYHLPFFYDEIIEGGHGAGANLKEMADTWAVTYTYLAMKLM